MEKFLTLNNDGVELLVAGNFAAAEQSLKAAFLYLGELLGKNQNKINHRQATFKNLILESRRVPNIPSKPSCGQLNYIYRSAIIANMDPTFQGESEIPNSKGLTALVTFNIALCYHCNENKFGSIANQWKVIRLYRSALRALQASPWESHMIYNAMTTLGIWNNMGVIHYRLSNYLESANCFGKLENIYQKSKFTCLPTYSRSGILMNMKRVVELLPAPAA
mmetsp:Transcript_28946/g.43723  ORF Transcript_28946/g.43723 Transcript_28946/m.43723 type:complete len:221 (-) Transcript_28946:41-703(-)